MLHEIGLAIREVMRSALYKMLCISKDSIHPILYNEVCTHVSCIYNFINFL